MRQAATAGLAFYSDGTPTGAANTRDRGELRELTRAALANTSGLLAELGRTGGGFHEQCASAGPPASRAAAGLSHALFRLLITPSGEARRRLLSGEALGEDVADLFDSGLPWSDMVHSGWPVFKLAAMLENEIRRPLSSTLLMLRLYAEDEAEGCTHEQEVFRETAVLLSGEGRTARLQDVRGFLRQSLDGDHAQDAGPKFILDVLYGDVLEGGRCPAAFAMAFAALADALQCHYHRPRSVQTRALADAAVERAQRRTSKAFGKSGLGALLTSRWPIVNFLARLEPPPQQRPPAPSEVAEEASSAVTLVSWSSREAELGGLNWAERFVSEVFGGLEGVELRQDVECADIYVFRSKVPINFGGVLLFVDGERSPDDGNLQRLLAAYPASIVVGPLSAGGHALHFPVPYASTSFASRAANTPADLLAPRAPEPAAGPRRLAAYLAYRCWEHRERFFRLLDASARSAGLGGVDVLSRCGNTSMTEDERRSARYSATYMDDAAELFRGYRFALVFENRLSPRYVTEKIVSAFLAGAVPIYWGSPFVLRLFNPHAFVYVNSFISFEAAARRVVDLALDPRAYEAYLQAPVLQNTTAARWHFSWHRGAPPLPPGEPTLREELAAAALERHRAGLGGLMPAVERRPWDYLDFF